MSYVNYVNNNNYHVLIIIVYLLLLLFIFVKSSIFTYIDSFSFFIFRREVRCNFFDDFLILPSTIVEVVYGSLQFGK